MGMYDLYQEWFNDSEVTMNRRRYDNLVHDFALINDITRRGGVIHRDGFDGFREFGGVWSNQYAGRIFDHVRIYKTRLGGRIAVSQPYLTTDQIMKAIISDIPFVSHCINHNYHIHIFEGDRYRWWNEICNLIVFDYNPDRSDDEPLPSNHLEIVVNRADGSEHVLLISLSITKEFSVKPDTDDSGTK